MKSLLFTCLEEVAFISFPQKALAYMVMINYLSKFGFSSELFFHLKWKGTIRTWRGCCREKSTASPVEVCGTVLCVESPGRFIQQMSHFLQQLRILGLGIKCSMFIKVSIGIKYCY